MTLVLPAGWTAVRLSDIAEVQLGRQRSPQNHEGPHMRPYLRAANVTWAGLNTDDVKMMNFSPAEFERFRLRVGDLLLSEASGSRYEVGKPAIWNDEVPGACFQNTLIRVRPLDADLTPFLHASLKYCAVSGAFGRASTGTGIHHLGQQAAAQWPIALPPLAEQRRIVAKLDDLLVRTRRAREALEVVPSLLERLRQAILASAFLGDMTKEWRAANGCSENGGQLLTRIQEMRNEQASLHPRRSLVSVTPKEEEIPSRTTSQSSALMNLPATWAYARWQDVGFCQNGRSFPSKHYQESGVKLLRPGNLHVSGRLLWNADNTRYMPPAWVSDNATHIVRGNELVMNLTAQSLKDEFLGRVCLTEEGEEAFLNQRIARLTPLLLSPRFCLWLFKSPLFRRYVDGLNTGSLIQHMFTSHIDQFVLPLPPLAEQDEIVCQIESRIAAIDAVVGATQQAEGKFEALNRAALAKAFRGELVPQDPNDEPASALLERIRSERAAAATTLRKGRKKVPASWSSHGR